MSKDLEPQSTFRNDPTQQSELIDDVEMAFEMARAEKPLREFASEVINIHKRQDLYDMVTASADEVGNNAAIRYIERRGRATEVAEVTKLLLEVEPGNDAFTSRAQLATCAREHGFTMPAAYKGFNRVVENVKVLEEHGLKNVVLDDALTLRLDMRTLAFLQTILSPKQFELMEIYYDENS